MIDTRPPIPYSPEIETIEPDEEQTAMELVDTLRGIGKKTFEDYGRGMRSVHAKCHGLLMGGLRVCAGLAPELAQGLFKAPAYYPAVVRISTSPGDPIHDSVSLPRGLAIKVIGVEGQRFEVGVPGQTQDFVLGNGPVFLKNDPKAFLRNLKLLAATTDRAEGTKRAMSTVLRGAEKALEAVGGESKTIKALGGHPETHPLGDTYFSQGALRFGEFFGKLSLQPVLPSLRELTDKEIEIGNNDHALRDAVVDYFAETDGEWELGVQLCTDLDEMPAEDPTKEWDAAKHPFRPVARLLIPAQRAWIPGESEALDQRLSFNPWHALLDHQPLGAIMRTRRTVYAAMSSFRAGQNRVPIVEPSSVDELDWPRGT